MNEGPRRYFKPYYNSIIFIRMLLVWDVMDEVMGVAEVMSVAWSVANFTTLPFSLECLQGFAESLQQKLSQTISTVESRTMAAQNAIFGNDLTLQTSCCKDSRKTLYCALQVGCQSALPATVHKTILCCPMWSIFTTKYAFSYCVVCSLHTLCLTTNLQSTIPGMGSSNTPTATTCHSPAPLQ